MSDEVISITGLGYVGLPLASALADHFQVIGFDISIDRIKQLSMGYDLTGEIPVVQQLLKRRLDFTNDPARLFAATFHIIAVPTPIDESNRPDLSALIGATRTVAKQLKPGDMVVYESTVYPGATEEDCVPVLESVSGLKCGVDFSVGYSPERINPGDKKHGLADVVKVISAQDGGGLDRMDAVYGSVVKAGLHVAPNIRVAEAAKILENTQRDVNVALMNEFAIICDRLGIDTGEVLDAAGTKWNFARFTPGLVGGHCIGVDPYYLIEKSERMGYNPQMLKACRRINDGMGKFIAQKAIKALAKRGGIPLGPSVNILGFTFKENCSDIRNTKVVDIITELRAFGFAVEVHDPLADPEQVFEEYGIKVRRKLNDMPKADMLVIATAHDEYKQLHPTQLGFLVDIGDPIVDVKGVLPESTRRLLKFPVIRI